MDPKKFTTIAHSGHRYYSPLSEAKAAALVALFRLDPGDRVLDIGCGRAQLLLDILRANSGSHGVGVDNNAAFGVLAAANAETSGLAGRLTMIARPLLEVSTRHLEGEARGDRGNRESAHATDAQHFIRRQTDAEAEVSDQGNFASIVCVGSSQAIGSFADALAWSFRALRPGGVALFANGYWKQPPADEYLRVLSASADEMQTHSGNAALARHAGYRVLYTMTSSDDEWDEYEGRYCSAVERYIASNPDDPDIEAMGQRIRPWHDAYLRWGRDTLGFGFYFLLKPARG